MSGRRLEDLGVLLSFRCPSQLAQDLGEFLVVLRRQIPNAKRTEAILALLVKGLAKAKEEAGR